MLQTGIARPAEAVPERHVRETQKLRCRVLKEKFGAKMWEPAWT
jgi:hypothetical protein